MTTLPIPGMVIKHRMKPPGRRRIFDATILKEVPYGIYTLATFFGFVGQYIPYFHIEIFAIGHGMDLSFYILTFLNVGSIRVRMLPSLVAGNSSSHCTFLQHVRLAPRFWPSAGSPSRRVRLA